MYYINIVLILSRCSSLVERIIGNAEVDGSIPFNGTRFYYILIYMLSIFNNIFLKLVNFSKKNKKFIFLSILSQILIIILIRFFVILIAQVNNIIFFINQLVIFNNNLNKVISNLSVIVFFSFFAKLFHLYIKYTSALHEKHLTDKNVDKNLKEVLLVILLQWRMVIIWFFLLTTMMIISPKIFLVYIILLLIFLELKKFFANFKIKVFISFGLYFLFIFLVSKFVSTNPNIVIPAVMKTIPSTIIFLNTLIPSYKKLMQHGKKL